MAKKSWKGFTLIELLVVVAIIAVLISILLPSLGRAREMAKSVSCLSLQKQMGFGISCYTNEEKGKLPPIHDFYVHGSTEGGWYYSWRWMITKYVGNDLKTFLCPSDGSVTYSYPLCDSWLNLRLKSIGSSYWQTFAGQRSYVGSYGMNYYSIQALGTGMWPKTLTPESIISPDSKLLVTDNRGDTAVIPQPGGMTDVNWATQFSARHMGGLNLLYADFHAANFNEGRVKLWVSKMDFSGNYWQWKIPNEWKIWPD
jgi:prepilin-type N-terminal cleavage/methylation domain-containing protein/prepilin-type processing-associated H-X9-DG protein